MRKFAQERLSAKQKVRTANLREGQKKLTGPASVDVGKYAGLEMRPAELVFRSPGYFFWAVENRIFKGELSFQAWEISQKARHIKPPNKRGALDQFDIHLDKEGRFTDYEVVPRGQELSDDPRILRVRHLDLSLLSNSGPEPDAATEKLLRKIRRNFLPKGKLNRWVYQDFFNDLTKFDLHCREVHCPKVQRLIASRP